MWGPSGICHVLQTLHSFQIFGCVDEVAIMLSGMIRMNYPLSGTGIILYRFIRFIYIGDKDTYCNEWNFNGKNRISKWSKSPRFDQAFPNAIFTCCFFADQMF